MAPAVEEILDGLNEQQAAAVTATGGSVLVIAGAGSGKTRVLTRRIAYLLATGVHPSSILAITFTNKAAREMAERVSVLVGEEARSLWVSTFHSACARILRQHPDLGGLTSGFTIYDADDSRRLLERTIRALELDTKRFPARAILSRISSAKADLVTAEEFGAAAHGSHDRLVAAIFTAYEQALLQANATDFDNLINMVVSGLRTHPEVRDYYRRRFRYLLIDEYQDTNRAQHELIAELAGTEGEVFAVGDSDQSIYGFRGANIGNILDFAGRFEGAREIPLEQNYRSTNSILAIANALIEHNHRRQEKRLWSALGDGVPAVHYVAMDDRDEAAFVADSISKLVSSERLRFRDMAVIYRTNAQSRRIEEAMGLAGLPYQVIGGVRFYERREIKDVICYLRLIANPDDDVSLLRVINVPRRQIGAGTQEQLAAAARARGISMLAALEGYPLSELGLSPRAGRALVRFSELIARLRNLAAGTLEAAPLLDEVISTTEYLEYLGDADPIELEGRLENLQELRRVASEAGTLVAFLEQSALFGAVDAAIDERGVTLMTVHMAKGLEFPAVFIAGLEEGVFPHVRSFIDRDDIEEERRLLYVAVTRAKDRLYLSSARRRLFQGDPIYNPESRFLSEIPEKLIERIEGSFPEARPSRPLPPRPTPQSLGYSAGDRVFHVRYGEGVVTRVVPKSVDTEVSVAFSSGGERHFFASMTRLKRL